MKLQEPIVLTMFILLRFLERFAGRCRLRSEARLVLNLIPQLVRGVLKGSARLTKFNRLLMTSGCTRRSIEPQTAAAPFGFATVWQLAPSGRLLRRRTCECIR